MAKVLGRGLNIAAQINATRANLPNWTPIEQLQDFTVSNLGCGYMQSYFLLTDGQLLKNGNYMDTLTSMRLLNFYRLFPRSFRIIQKMRFLGPIMSFRGGEEQLTLLNRVELENKVYFKKVVFGQSGINLFDDSGNMWVIGENYFGQRGTGDCMTNESSLRKVEGINVKVRDGTEKREYTTKIKDISLGFQHSILITERGEAYGCGKADSHQIQPYLYHHSTDTITVDKIQKPELVWSRMKVVKAACGYKHTIVMTEDEKMYSMGLNNFGQCGHDYTKFPSLSKMTPIFFPFRNGQKVLDIKCGSHHTLILTNMDVYFMGSIKNNQNPFTLYQEHVSSPTPFNLQSKPIKIFANFDRSAVITEDGCAHIFGGKDLSHIGGESGKLDVLSDWKFDRDSLIGLGFSHTIICP